MGNYLSSKHIETTLTQSERSVESNSETATAKIFKALGDGKFNDAYESIKNEKLFTFDILLSVIENSIYISEELAMRIILNLITENQELRLEISKNYMDVYKVINNESFLKLHFKKNLLKYIIRNIDNSEFNKMVFISALEKKAVKCVKMMANYSEMYSQTIDLRGEEWNYYTYDYTTLRFVKITVEDAKKIPSDKLVIRISELLDWKKYIFKNIKFELDGTTKESLEEVQDILKILGNDERNSVHMELYSK